MSSTSCPQVTFRLIPPHCMSPPLFLTVHRQLPNFRNILRCICTCQMSSSKHHCQPKPSSKKPLSKDSSINHSKMGKKKSNTPGEEYLLPKPPSSLGILPILSTVKGTKRGNTRMCSISSRQCMIMKAGTWRLSWTCDVRRLYKNSGRR